MFAFFARFLGVKYRFCKNKSPVHKKKDIYVVSSEALSLVEDSNEKNNAMKTKLFVIVFFSLVLATGCSRCPEQKSLKEEAEAVENVLEKYMIAIENMDYLAIENIWEPGDSTIMLGTDSHEFLVGWDKIQQAYQKQFSLISDVFISVQDQRIRLNATGNTAWFTQKMTYNFIYEGVARHFEGIRFTGVLQKNQDNKWKMVQGHLSMPAHINIGK